MMTRTRAFAFSAAAMLALGVAACTPYYEPAPSARTPGEQNPWTTNAPAAQPPQGRYLVPQPYMAPGQH
jgi:hypothetical protein